MEKSKPPVPALWLPINKPSGYTSHDIVAIARKRLQIRKIGHSGTLDPDATGVLVLAIGKATRFIQYLEGQKQYRAKIRLGITTDTQDASGTILKETEVPSLDLEGVQTVLAQFVGPQEQIPPMYSAISINGQRLYQLARQGKTIERPARSIVIHEIRVESLNLPEFDILVTCSAGTYIRTLAYDIGEKIGCGAHLKTLQRTQANGFNLEQTVSLDALSESSLETHGLSPDYPLGHFQELHLDEAEGVRFLQGQRIYKPDLSSALYKIYGAAQHFLGFGDCKEEVLAPRLVIPFD